MTNKQCFFIWNPNPAVGDIATEKSEHVIHNRTLLDYVLILLRLFPYIWQNKLHKITDIILTISVETSLWSKPMHEPLVLVIILPSYNQSHFKRIISKMFM